MATDLIAPVTADIVVPVDPTTAFDLYVHRPGRTHPEEGMSGRPAEIVYEPVPGGRWYERGPGGQEHDWGRVLEYDPPHRLVLAWMVGASAGGWEFDPDPAHASRAEITFKPVDAGTRVSVAHTGLEAHGEGAASILRGVSGGWQRDLLDLDRAASGLPGVTSTQINLFCADVQADLDFYRSLGFEMKFRVPDRGPIEHVEVEAAGTRIGLVDSRVASAETGVAAGGSSAGAELVLWCADVDRLHEAALARGATEVVPPADTPGGARRTSWWTGPGGHLVHLVSLAS